MLLRINTARDFWAWYYEKAHELLANVDILTDVYVLKQNELTKNLLLDFFSPTTLYGL